MFNVLFNNKILFTGTNNQCFDFLLKYQPFSVDYALKYGGYKLVKQQ